jgi:hypothetical protein
MQFQQAILALQILALQQSGGIEVFPQKPAHVQLQEELNLRKKLEQEMYQQKQQRNTQPKKNKKQYKQCKSMQQPKMGGNHRVSQSPKKK